MTTNDRYKTVRDFLTKMDAGEFGDQLVEELGKLTNEQRDELTTVLMKRHVDRHYSN